MVRCAISPDGQYIVAGSEDGKPHIWGSSLEEYFKTTAYECKLLDLVSDVVWNPRYNMFALSGFGSISQFWSTFIRGLKMSLISSCYLARASQLIQSGRLTGTKIASRNKEENSKSKTVNLLAQMTRIGMGLETLLRERTIEFIEIAN